MKNNLSISLLSSVIILTVFTGCQSEKPANLRVVNSQGEPVELDKKVPVFNMRQLQKQQMFKEQNGGITLIDESGPKTFSSKGNNYAYAEKQDELPESLFADRIEARDSRVIIKNNGVEGTVAEPTEKDAKPSSSVVSASDIELNSKKDENGVAYLFSEEQEKARSKAKAHSSDVVSLNQTSKQSSSASKGSTESKSNYYLQLGAFKSKNGADTMLKDYKKISNGEIKVVTVNNQKIYRVVLGPYDTKFAAEANKEKVIKTGHYDVFITKR